MKFALRDKAPRKSVKDVRNSILRHLGILHTKKSLVGNEFIRGIRIDAAHMECIIIQLIE